MNRVVCFLAVLALLAMAPAAQAQQNTPCGPIKPPTGYGVPTEYDIAQARIRILRANIAEIRLNPADVAIAGFATNYAMEVARQQLARGCR